MSIVKRGEETPIVSCYCADGKEIKCLKCGRKLIVVAMSENENKLVCNYCDFDEDE